MLPELFYSKRKIALYYFIKIYENNDKDYKYGLNCLKKRVISLLQYIQFHSYKYPTQLTPITPLLKKMVLILS